MKRNKPEEQIQKKIHARLDWWIKTGIVIDYIDISNLGRKFNPYGGSWIMNTSQGRPDILVWLVHNLILHSLFIEVKNPKSFKHSDEQKKYQKRWWMKNSHYILAFSPDCVSKKIEEVTNYSSQLLNNIPNPG